MKAYAEKTKQWFDMSTSRKTLTPCDPPPEFAQPNVEEAKRIISECVGLISMPMLSSEVTLHSKLFDALAALSGEGEQKQCPNDTDDAGAKIITGLKEFRYKLQGGGSIKGTTLMKCKCGELVRFPCEIKYPATKADPTPHENGKAKAKAVADEYGFSVEYVEEGYYKGYVTVSEIHRRALHVDHELLPTPEEIAAGGCSFTVGEDA